MQIAARDKEGLDRIELEYRVNNESAQTHLLRKGKGVTLVFFETELSLKKLVRDGLVKEGNRLDVRIKITDNLQVSQGKYTVKKKAIPDRDLHPHVRYYPSRGEGRNGWISLTVDASAEPLQQREIVAQHKGVREKIDALRKKLELRQIILKDLKNQGKEKKFLNKLESEELVDLLQDTRSIKDDLHKLAQEAKKFSDLKDVARKTQDVANQEMKKGNEALSNALVQKTKQEKRQPLMAKADEEFNEAVKRLKDLQKPNDQVAQTRLESMKLKQLGQKESDLGDQVKDLENKNLQDDPALLAQLEKLKQEHAKIAQQLQKMTGEDPLGKAMKLAQAEQADKLGQQAKELAQLQRELMAQADQEYQNQMEKLLAEFARKQQALADQAAQLGKETVAEMQAKKLTPLDPTPPQHAADSLNKGKAIPALQQQKQAQAELERMAKNLDRLAYRLGFLNFKGQPRQVLIQLADFQEKLEEQLLDEAAQFARKMPYQEKEIRAVLKDIYLGQSKIQQTMRDLQFPPPGKLAQSVIREAQKNANQAVKSMKKANWLEAYKSMQKTRDSLKQMVRGIPEIPKKINPFKNQPENDQAKEAEKQAQQFHKLAEEQKQLHDELQRFLSQPKLENLSGKDHPLAKLAKEQEDLQGKANHLMKEFQKLAQDQKELPQAKKSAENAAKSSQDAEMSMKVAQDKTQQGQVPLAKQSGENAAKMLEKAAQEAKQLAFQLTQSKPQEEKPGMKIEGEAAKSLKEGQAKMNQAQKQLNQGQMGPASQSMKQAAQALKVASQKMLPKGSQFSPQGNLPNQGLPPPRTGSQEMEQAPPLELLKGSIWKRSSGKLKSGVLSDTRPDYGPAYSEIIRRYREALQKLKQ